MKIFLTLSVLIAATAFTATAQDHDRRAPLPDPRVGIKAGPNLSNLTVSEDGNVNYKHAILGYHAGLYMDFPLVPLVSVQPGILITTKGARYTLGDDNSSTYTEVSTRPLYIEVPVNIVVKLPLPNKVKLFAGAGPYGAVGVSGKNRTEGKLLGTSFQHTRDIGYGDDNPQTNTNGSAFSGDLKRFDFGLNILAGLEISHFTLSANYGYGLLNVSPASAGGDARYQNRVFGVSVGILF